MKYFKILSFIVITILAISCKADKKELEWKMGIQTYSFHKFTLMEALDKTQQLGLKYAEAYFGQTLGGSFTDTVYLDMTLPDSIRKQLKDEFAKRNITLYSFGVAFYDTPEDWERFFAFAKDMDIHTVTCEPKLEHLDSVEQLALKYNIEVAIHNHPNPSIYADPQVLLKALEGRNSIMGVCADIGHWKRTGNNPVETLKLFEGKIKVVHMKELDDKLEDITWGTGILGVKEVLQELQRQNFDGLMSVEYENYGDNQLDDIVKSLKYLSDVIH